MSVSMSGILDKEGEKGLVKRCKTRYFEVIGTNMNYYRTKGDALIGTIDLKLASDVLPNTKNQGKNAFGFEIRTPDRVWFLYAETQPEQETWVSHIRDILNTQRYTTAPPSAAPVLETKQSFRLSSASDGSNGDTEPPQVPQKPRVLGVPPKAPAKKFGPPIPKVPGPGPAGNPSTAPAAKKAGPPPIPKGFGQSSPSGPTSNGFGSQSNSSHAPTQSNLNAPAKGRGPPPPVPGARPHVKASSSTAPPNVTGQVTPPKKPNPPPRPPGAAPSSSDVLGGTQPAYTKRKDSAQRATTGTLQPPTGSHQSTTTHSSSNLGTLRSGLSSAALPTSSPPASPAAAAPPVPAAPTTTNAEKRTKTANEVLQTEKYYYECVTSLRDDFQTPLLTAAKSGTDGFSEADVVTMFSPILQMIIPVNQELLQGLETRMANFDPMTTVLGDVFVNIGPFLKMYLEYSRNYQTAIDTYNRLVKDNPNFVQRLQSSKDRSSTKLALEHLLIMPVQRIPRYLLLLGELKKETGSDHPDYAPLEKAIGLIESVANHINEQMKRLEVGSKALAYPELVAPYRYLMWEGTIETRFDKEKEEGKFVLFNDMLLHHPAKKITKGSKWHLQPESVCSIQLVWTAPASVQVKESSAAIGPMETIDLILPAKRMTVVAQTVEERNFLKALREAMLRHFGTEHAPSEREADHVFSDEATYRGSWKDGKQHGTGTMEYKGIATYSGGWVNGMKQGQGSMAWMSGNTYDGLWMAGAPHGNGTFTWPNRDTYVGSFIEGLKSGHGTFKWASGATYVGDWVKDKPGGTGTYDSPSEFYEGSWLDGFFHGTGNFKEKLTGRMYEGQWQNGTREGTGVCRYIDGSEYNGHWKKNRRDGKGVLTAKLGKGVETYNGDWSDDKRTGNGVLTTADGSVYEGNFKDDMRHGKGKLKFADSDPGIRLRYEGEFDNDRMSGKGTLWYQNGDMFDGYFKDNAFHGQGTFQYTSSIKTEGKWSMGQLEGKGGIFQVLSPTDKKPTHITGTFSHGQFTRSKDAATKFDIPVAPASTTINTTRL